MTRILRSTTKKIQNSEDLSSKVTVSKKSKTIKRSDKKDIEAKNEDSRQNDVWNISSILSNIFTYTDHKDLVEFNTVCKRWNHLTNPIIHKTIKLIRSWDIIDQIYDKKLNYSALIDAELAECISNNAKHARLVNESRFNYKSDPRRAIEVFETFKFIHSLTIEFCNMSQDQFLGMISPLTQLQELSIRGLGIKKIKLRIENIKLIGNPELFIQTINSHNNLVYFYIQSQSSQALLEPFFKHYLTLLNFEYNNVELQTPQSLFVIFENNPQLISLKLSLECWNSKLVSHISSYLTSLEELNLSESNRYGNDYTDVNLKFSQPTKIKKLNLSWYKSGNYSLDSILQNCPDLAELSLNRYNNYHSTGSELFIKLSKSIKLKKLEIYCDGLGRGVFDSILLNCPHINQLNIRLPCEWKEVLKSIHEMCGNLERLDIFSPYRMNMQEFNSFYQEFYETEFFSSNPICKSTLTHLILSGFKVIDSKAEYFKNFEKLKSIKYLGQSKIDYNSFNQETEIDMDLWPGYKLISKDKNHSYDVELKRN
ncbi:hypothetical protein CONCODRAFT_11799 [Conidiobolus coronatus NRRL 28638]|uniref:F-box domain-containing protein n=1 Tax=Conidiobolus coronatus (strain ATCC 28846 / CBS 209.66 / NRRL 28638) TaxID=796925 RepID=A0A137NUV1_CONC2|nr:hypothetical protein CONCODRAFT_11799 [Conidiobolus coronatus NRRL 28638]|eukprot:KXN66384.1 hypothetical protein CONCODRAFT_11799 [Conidiobolus coronatus NRRL 28638]